MNHEWKQLQSMLAALTVVAAVDVTPALAADTPQAEAQSRYQQERAACLTGQTPQDRDTCLREASAAYAEARRGRLDDGPEDYGRNALKRCRPLPTEDRRDCEARIHGLGTVSGSVASGGILRELVTVEVGPPPAESSSDKAGQAR